jgi:hypothetical protein
MFILKLPSTQPRVLNYEMCPPHDVVHDPESYPTFYDPLYYPHYHPQIFSTPEDFCTWLQACLSSHRDVCHICCPLYKSIAVVHDGSVLCVRVDDYSIPFARSFFESASYSHCSVFRRHASSATACSTDAIHHAAASCMASCLDDNPYWFTYSDDCIRSHLLKLLAPTLSTAARLVCKMKSQVPRNKNGCVNFIMNHFSAQKTRLSVMTSEHLLDHLSSTPLPRGCPRTRSTILTAYFETIYGEHVARALRAPPEITAVFDVPSVSSAAAADLSMPWISASLDDLTRRMEKLSRADIQVCLSRIHSPFPKQHSHRKTCNALANHIRLRALLLFQAGPSALARVFLAHFPFTDSYDQSNVVLLAQILDYEFGHGVMTRLSQELLSRSGRLKVVRDQHRRNVIEEASTIRVAQEAEWPTCVPQNVVLNCLNDYMAGSAWTEPPVCAVCSCYEHDVLYISLSDDLVPYHLDLLRVPNDIASQVCIPGSESRPFSFGNASIDGLMLVNEGLVFHDSGDVSITACKSCVSSLCKDKMPQLALANNLYRGSLPVEFHDLTWVKEKICAIYSITAHVTQLFQSSDPAQPKVFHGNTCAHDMNVVSTVSVLPCTVEDINGFISMVFIGPEKFDPKQFTTLFWVHKHKIWSSLMWLTQHNILYAGIMLDQTIMDSYPDDGPLPGLCDAVVQDHELDAHTVFDIEMAGFTPHPAELL